MTLTDWQLGPFPPHTLLEGSLGVTFDLICIYMEYKRGDETQPCGLSVIRARQLEVLLIHACVILSLSKFVVYY